MNRVAWAAHHLAAVVLLASSGCDEIAGDVGGEAAAVHSVISSRIVVETPKGPAEIWVTWDGREWTSGDSAFSGRPDAFREGLVVDTRKWPGGIVPYYWPISSASDCMSDQDSWCAGERDRAEEISIDVDGIITAVGPVARGKLTLADRSSTTFVDVTDLGTNRPPEAMRIIRQDWQLDGEEPVACNLADNSTAPEKWLVRYGSDVWMGGGNWLLQLMLGLPGELPVNISSPFASLEDLTFDTYLALRDDATWCPGCGGPVTVGAVPGDVTITRSESGADFEPTFPSPPSPDYEIRELQSACLGDGCANFSCDAPFVCNTLFNPVSGEYDAGSALCQKSNGLARIGTLVDPSEPGAGSGPPFVKLGNHHLSLPRIGTIVHELMHTLGFIHEQNRPDAANFLELAREDCADPTRLDGDLNLSRPFDGPGGTGVLHEGENSGFGLSPNEPGAFDFVSTMLYPSTNACLNDDPGCNGQCLVASTADQCPDELCRKNPIGPGWQIRVGDWKVPDEDFGKAPGRGVVVSGARPRGISEKDMDAMRWYYPNGFERSVEFGVLNSHEDCLADPNCRDSPLVADCFLDPPPAGLDCFPWVGDESGDRFGSVVELASFGDENNAILVGVPDEALDWPPSPTGSGIVAILEGRFWSAHRALRRIPTHGRSHTVSIDDALIQRFVGTGPAGGDRFGAAVTSLDINADGWGDLAVTAPAREEVFVFRGQSGHREQRELLGVIPALLAGEEFGFALSSARLDGQDVLLVGAPGSGRVYIYTETDVTMGIPSGILVSPAHPPGTRFGEAVTSLPDVLGGPRDEIIVGAPEAGGDDGAVIVFDSPQLVGSATPSLVVEGEAGDELGADLDAGILSSDLPGGAVAATAPLGRRVYVLYNDPMSAQPLTELVVVDKADTQGPLDPGDGFARSVAIADEREDGSGLLVVGAPGENALGGVDTGAIYFIRFNVAGNALEVESGTRHDTGDVLPCLDTGFLPFDVECAQSLEPSPTSFSQLGAAVGANEDIIVAGAPGAWASGKDQAGRVYVWVRGRQDEPEPIVPGSYDPDSFFLMHWFSQSENGPELRAYDE